MVVIEYYAHSFRVGMLAWVSDGQARRAMGGFDVKPGYEVTKTVVTTDQETRILQGQVHPDRIKEISGEDWEITILEIIQNYHKHP